MNWFEHYQGKEERDSEKFDGHFEESKELRCIVSPGRLQAYYEENLLHKHQDQQKPKLVAP